MRTVVQETAFQIAVRNFSQVVGRRSVNMWFWWRGSSCNQAHIFCRRLLLVSQRFLLVMRCICHHEGFWCLSAYEEMGLSRWLSGQESTYQCRRHRRCGFDLWVRKIPWRRKWQPTPVSVPGMDREAWRAIILGVAKSWMGLRDWAQIWRDTRIGLTQLPLENIWLCENQFCQFFLEHRAQHFCSPPWTSFKCCWKPATAAAHDWILVEVDGKCQFVADSFKKDKVRRTEYGPPVVKLRLRWKLLETQGLKL